MIPRRDGGPVADSIKSQKMFPPSRDGHKTNMVGHMGGNTLFLSVCDCSLSQT